MKYLKTYEDYNENVNIGDYVICHEKGLINKGISDFISNNIGKITDINYYNSATPYDVEYENIPPTLLNNYFGYNNKENNRIMSGDEIIFSSPNKIEVETYLQKSKFNL